MMKYLMMKYLLLLWKCIAKTCYGFKRGQKHSSQLHISLESCNFVCSLITALLGFAKVTYMGCDH